MQQHLFEHFSREGHITYNLSQGVIQDTRIDIINFSQKVKRVCRRSL